MDSHAVSVKIEDMETSSGDDVKIKNEKEAFSSRVYLKMEDELILPFEVGVDDPKRDGIKALYFGARVLVTGATGFIGKVLLESLLRKTEVEKIYIIIRSKRNKTPEERLKELLKDEIFTELEKTRPERLSAVVPLHGDVGHPSLDLSPEDADLLEREVDIVFHNAATVRFNENLKVAAETNLRGTKLIMELARRMERLKVIIHCSTGYALNFIEQIEEKIYPAEEIDLLKIAEAITEETADRITKVIIGKSTNTYVYTKHLTEYLIDKDFRDLPVGIIRPAIVVSSLKDPLPGYIDNHYGPTGLTLEIMNGRAHCLTAAASGKAQLVPADYVVNALIAAAWDTFHSFKKKKETPVFNIAPGTVAPLEWAEFMKVVLREARTEAPGNSSWYPFCFLACNKQKVLLISYLFHVIPAVILDIACKLLGKEPIMLKLAMKYDKANKILIPFAPSKWVFHINNLNSIWKKMSKEEHELFPFSFEGFNWESYLVIYINGIKHFLMKDSISRKDSRQKAQRHFIHHCCLVIFMQAIFSCILYSLFY